MATDIIARGMAAGSIKPGSDGKIPAEYLPSYIDDVVDLIAVTDTAPATCAEGDKYYNTTDKLIYTAVATDTWGTTGETPEDGKIYLNISTNPSESYRWSGTELVIIGQDLSDYYTKEDTNALLNNLQTIFVHDASYGASASNPIIFSDLKPGTHILQVNRSGLIYTKASPSHEVDSGYSLANMVETKIYVVKTYKSDLPNQTTLAYIYQYYTGGNERIQFNMIKTSDNSTSGLGVFPGETSNASIGWHTGYQNEHFYKGASFHNNTYPVMHNMSAMPTQNNELVPKQYVDNIEFKVYLHDSDEGLSDTTPIIVNTLNVGLHIFKCMPRNFKATPNHSNVYLDNNFGTNKLYIFKKWSESMTNGEVFGYFDNLDINNKRYGIGTIMYIDHGNYIVFGSMNYRGTRELIPTNENTFYNYVTFHNYLPNTYNAPTPTIDTQLVTKKYVDGLIPQVATLPTAASTNEGRIYQFTGTTDANYTNGYFYKCVSDGAASPTYSWEQINVQSGGGSTNVVYLGLASQYNSDANALDIGNLNSNCLYIIDPYDNTSPIPNNNVGTAKMKLKANVAGTDKIVEINLNKPYDNYNSLVRKTNAYNFVYLTKIADIPSQVGTVTEIARVNTRCYRNENPNVDIPSGEAIYLQSIKVNASGNLEASLLANFEYNQGNNVTTTALTQTIAGKKNFSVLPESSVTPTTDYQLVNKKYVDDSISVKTYELSGLSAYSSASTYAVDDYVYYNNLIYKCNTAVTVAEPFDSQKWTQKTYIEYMTDMIVGSALTQNY